MRKTVLSMILMLSAAISASGMNGNGQASMAGAGRGSLFLSVRLGLTSFAETDEPFDVRDFPLGVSLEYGISEHWILGAGAILGGWSDYLGMFGGRYDFRIIRTSLNLAYLIHPGGISGLNVRAGMDAGFDIFSVKNELGNEYPGDLKGGPVLAPFVAADVFPWPNTRGFLGRWGLTAQAGWALVGDFRGGYVVVGMKCRLL